MKSDMIMLPQTNSTICWGTSAIWCWGSGGESNLCKNKIKVNSLYKIILLMSNSPTQQLDPEKIFNHRKYSDSPLTDHSEHESSTFSKPILSALDAADLRQHLYDQLVPHYPLSERMNRKGVNWLLTISWSRGFGQPCAWTALLLFYAYKTHFPFGKEEMEGISKYSFI